MVAAAVVGAAVVGGVVASKAAKKGSQAQVRAAEIGAAGLTAAQERAERLGRPFLELGEVGAEQLTSFLQDPNQQQEEINPIVSFLREQGFEAIQESAAARGRLGAGGTLKDLTRFSEGLASTVAPQLQQQRFNQLFNVAGLGANVAAGQGTQAIGTAGQVAQLQGQAGQAEARGAFAPAQALSGTIENIAGIAGAFPSLFGGNTKVDTTATPTTPINFGDLSFAQGAQSGLPAATF